MDYGWSMMIMSSKKTYFICYLYTSRINLKRMLVREDKNMCFYEIEEYREIQSSRLKKYIFKNVYGLESYIFYLCTKLLKM